MIVFQNHSLNGTFVIASPIVKYLDYRSCMWWEYHFTQADSEILYKPHQDQLEHIMDFGT